MTDRTIKLVLTSWGLAVLLMAAGVAWWVQHNQNEDIRARELLKRDQDRAMCQMIETITAGPEPVAGPAGDRGRAVRDAMRGYQAALRCAELIEVVEPDPVPANR